MSPFARVLLSRLLTCLVSRFVCLVMRDNDSDERFSIVCEDEHLYALFEQFLVTQFSVENLHFYNDVSQLHALTDAAEIAAACERVCKTYFGHDGSDAVLNVNEMIRAQVLKNLGRPSVHMFDMAYNDVEQLLKVRRRVPTEDELGCTG